MIVVDKHVRELVKAADVFSDVEVGLGGQVWFEKSGLRLAHGRIGKSDFL